MNPLAIKARNLRTFQELSLDFPTGCVVISGENGSGKSTILNAIDVALFADRGELPALLSLGEDELQLELRFEHNGEFYRVRRMFSAKGRGKTSLDLERCVPDTDEDDYGWEPLTRETAVATQAHLEQLLGLSRATFRASSFLAQGEGAAFTDAQPRDRKAILAEILGLSIYDRLLDLARQELRVAEHSTIALRTKIEALEQEATAGDQVRGEIVTATAELTTGLERQAAAEQTLERARDAQAANAAAVERLLHARAVVAAATEEQERARQAYDAAVQAGVDREQRQRDLDTAAEIAAHIPALEQRLAAAQETVRLVEQRAQLRREAEQRDLARERLAREATHLREHAANLNGKADHLDAHIGEAGDCDRCGQTLGAEAAARAAASFRTEAVQVLERAAEIETNADAEQVSITGLRERADAIAIVLPETIDDAAFLSQQLASARAAGERRAALAERVRQLAEQAVAQDELALALAAATDRLTAVEAEAASVTVADPSTLEHDITVARAAVASASEAVTVQRETIARLQVAEQRAQQAADALTAAAVEVETISKSVDVLKLAERAFGRDGIPALVVENSAIPSIELEANRILGELGGKTAGCRVELRTRRALKTSDALRESLDIIIVTSQGELAYESFSGGEKTRLNLALRIGLARLLAHRRGAESRVLCLDELDGLDAAGMDALAGVLQGLSGDFERILIVSHQPQLATAFDQVIRVVSDGEHSRIEVGVREPVAA